MPQWLISSQDRVIRFWMTSALSWPRVSSRRRNSVIAGLHPGTVDTELSKPFSGNVPDGKLFSPAQSAGYLLDVIDGLEPEDSGGIFAWDSQRIDY